jgi:hypothetical protein
MPQFPPGSQFSERFDPTSVVEAEVVDDNWPKWDPVVPRQPIKLDGMAYWESFTHQFRNPNWLTNVGWGILLMFLPIIGPLLFTGYLMRATDSQIRSNGQRDCDFNWDEIEDYLYRGLWAILVNFLVSLIFVPIIWGCFLLIFLAGMSIASLLGVWEQPDAGPKAAAVVSMYGIGFVCMICLNLVQMVFASPLVLRAGLGKDLGRAFDFAWIKDFVRKMWVEMVNSAVFMLFLGLALMPVGLLLCGVGIIPVAILLHIASAHLWYQWYSLYLQRGGKPILMQVPRPKMQRP